MNQPHSLEAEVSVLGAMLLSPHAYDAATVVTPDDFYRTAHRHVFDAIVKVAGRGVRADVVAVLDQLITDGRLEEVGGASAVHDLTAAVPTTANVLHYARIVAGHARRRRVIEAFSSAAHAAADPTVDLDATIQTATGSLLDTGSGGDGIVTVDDLYATVAARISDPDRPIPGVDTGWTTVDRLIRIVPGRLTVVTGAPGSGKSQWVDCLALNLAHRHGWKTALFSPEQGPPDEHLERLAWTRLGQDPSQLARNGAADRVADTFGWMQDVVCWLDDLESRTVPSILARAQTVKARRGLDLLVIDPFNKVRLDRSRGLRDDLVIQEVLADLVLWARRNAVHVIVVAHPTKLEKESPGSQRFRPPTVYDIAGGAEWNNQADTILTVWRDQAGEQDPPQMVRLSSGKVRRQGPSGWGQVSSCDLWFDPATLRYSTSSYPSATSRGDAA